jgi:DNA-binding transcriptional LysR family regulator
MDWDNIRIFLSVARARQFSAAASQLRLDNATVGRRINALENSLGVRLFDRQTTGSVLNSARKPPARGLATVSRRAD